MAAARQSPPTPTPHSSLPQTSSKSKSPRLPWIKKKIWIWKKIWKRMRIGKEAARAFRLGCLCPESKLPPPSLLRVFLRGPLCFKFFCLTPPSCRATLRRLPNESPRFCGEWPRLGGRLLQTRTDVPLKAVRPWGIGGTPGLSDGGRSGHLPKARRIAAILRRVAATPRTCATVPCRVAAVPRRVAAIARRPAIVPRQVAAPSHRVAEYPPLPVLPRGPHPNHAAPPSRGTRRRWHVSARGMVGPPATCTARMSDLPVSAVLQSNSVMVGQVVARAKRRSWCQSTWMPPIVIVSPGSGKVVP